MTYHGIRGIIKTLKGTTPKYKEENKMKKYWYAVLMDEDDNDWGTGSYDLDEAKKMARKYEDGMIAVIDEGNDPICVEIIRREDF